jgi:hypothetical protein
MYLNLSGYFKTPKRQLQKAGQRTYIFAHFAIKPSRALRGTFTDNENFAIVFY